MARAKKKSAKKKTSGRKKKAVTRKVSKKKTSKKSTMKKTTKKKASQKKSKKKSSQKKSSKKSKLKTKKKATKKKAAKKVTKKAKKKAKKTTKKSGKKKASSSIKKKRAPRENGEPKKKGALASLTSFVKKLTGAEVGCLEGLKAPSFRGASIKNESLKSSQFSDDILVLYFYPKDSTSGCTRQGEEFRDSYAAFLKEGAEILGVSRDSIKSHEKFAGKYNFPFDLLSDPDEIVCKAYGVLKMKSMYGRQYMGVERSTFVIGRHGKVLKEWRKVKVPGHVAEVLAFIQSLS